MRYNTFMYYVYVLWSKKDQHCYLGYTSNLKLRLAQHNDGENISTKHGGPWELIYYEAFKTKKLAHTREQTLKHRGKMYQELKKRIGIVKRSA